MRHALSIERIRQAPRREGKSDDGAPSLGIEMSDQLKKALSRAEQSHAGGEVKRGSHGAP
jgi:hypothetical protein